MVGPVRKLPAVLLSALVVALVSAAPAAAQTGDVGIDSAIKVFEKYAKVREDLFTCHRGRAYGTLSKDRQRGCRRLTRLYTLFTYAGGEFVHCNTSKCPPTPAGDPAANGPYPAGAVLIRWNK